MGIRFLCPNGHRLNVKAFQAGKRGVCPHCGEKFTIPFESTLPNSKDEEVEQQLDMPSIVDILDSNESLVDSAARRTRLMLDLRRRAARRKSARLVGLLVALVVALALVFLWVVGRS